MSNDDMTSDQELRKCWSCEMPQPDDFRRSLHLEECPEHDAETCRVCLNEDSD